MALADLLSVQAKITNNLNLLIFVLEVDNPMDSKNQQPYMNIVIKSRKNRLP